MNRRLLYAIVSICDAAVVIAAYYFGGWVWGTIAVIVSAAAFGLRYLLTHYRRPGLWRRICVNLRLAYRWTRNDVGFLELNSETNLIVGAAVDLIGAYLLVLLVSILWRIYIPTWSAILLALVLGGIKYAWSINFFKNHVPTLKMGTVTWLERIIPSGPTGGGLLPGYYWFPLGWPFFKLAFEESTQEFTVTFDNMQVWTKNSRVAGQGAIDGRTDGTAQFELINLNQYKGVELPRTVAEAITLEGARDVCEGRTIEEFIATRNDTLADEIADEIRRKLTARPSPLGIRLKSVNVKRTDNKSEAVKAGWEQINVQQATAVARATDAAARIRRIRAYTAAGVDANRAAALDAVASDKAGATIGDQRYNVDVGQSVKDIGDGLLAALARRIGG